jgi:hypothetical protein
MKFSYKAASAVAGNLGVQGKFLESSSGDWRQQQPHVCTDDIGCRSWAGYQWRAAESAPASMVRRGSTLAQLSQRDRDLLGAKLFPDLCGPERAERFG